MPALVAVALAWFFVRHNQLGGAFLVLLGFDCFLRTGELLSLTLADIVISEDDLGVVKLSHTKTGQRHAAFEASTILDPACGRLFRALKRQLPAGIHEDNYVFLPKAA